MHKRLTLALIYMLGVIVLGTLGFMYLEGMTFFQAFYLTVATITTVGYGDVIPLTSEGRVFTIGLMIVGVGIGLYFGSTIVALVIEGELAGAFGRRKMQKRIQALQQHIIVCGAGRVGYQVIERLKREEVKFVVIERDEDLVQKLRQEGVLAVAGDATEDSLLLELGIARARGLISALADDAQNVFVTLTGKGLNPKLHVVARMDKAESESKLYRAGADKVISPAVIGGRRMAISILKPGTCDYVDTLIHEKDQEVEIEEIRVNSCSQLANKTLQDARVKEISGINVLAIMREGRVISNPAPTQEIQGGDLLIALGTRAQMEKFEAIASGFCEFNNIQ